MIHFPALVSSIIEKNNIDAQFLYGHYRAIAADLSQQDKSPVYRDQKYPAILLGIDSDYREVEENGRVVVSCNFWVIEETKEEWFTTERYDNVFVPVLYPLAYQFIDALFNSNFIASSKQDMSIPIVPIPYWGTQNQQGSDSQIICDPLDAIKIEIRNLEIIKQC